MTALDEAIAHAGSQAALAALIGVSQPAISNWLARNRVPAWHAITLETATGIPRWRFRPDIFPPPDEAAA